MSRLKVLLALASILAVAATVNGLTIRVPFLVAVPERTMPGPSGCVVEVRTPPRPAPDGVVKWTVRPSHGEALPGSAVHVLVELSADRVVRASRSPINLALVLDRSGSMSARRKLEYAKAAAHIVIDQLAPTDRVAIVAFDSVSNVLLPSAPAADRAALHAIIDGLTPGGSTNVSGGLLDGMAEVQRHLMKEHVNRVMLMTDGLSNFGETAPEAFARISDSASAAGISVSTMGLGAEFSEDVLVAIAEHSGGRYYYIENPEQMSSIFRGEVQGMQAVVAHDLRVQLEAKGGAVVEQVFGYRGASLAPGAPLPLGDLFSGQTRKLVVRLRMPNNRPGDGGAAVRLEKPVDGSLLDVRLSYQDAATRNPVTGVKPAIVRATVDLARADGSADRAVVERVESVRAAARLEEAMTQLDRGDRSGAVRLLSEQVNSTRALNRAFVRSAQLDGQVAQMEAAMRQLDRVSGGTDEYRSYVKQQKAAAYELTR